MARILVIDDELDIVRAIVKMLSARGHDVDTGRDGNDCIARVEADPPDVLVIDAALPGLDGIELVRLLKTNEKTRHIPVVLMSSSYLSLGDGPAADEYVVKPFTREVLVHNVERLIPHGS
jgi:chemosensory pili system protein ChpA (sensor histidine kinase/response regulator)